MATSSAYYQEQTPASQEVLHPPSLNTSPAPLTTVVQLTHRLQWSGASNKALLPFESLRHLVEQTSVPPGFTNGLYKLQRRAFLRSPGIRNKRPPTYITQVCSVFGAEQPVTATTSAHAPAGWNTQLVLADGNPDISAILHAIKNITLPSAEAKLRLNAVESAWLMNNLYDNPTALLVNFLRLYYRTLYTETVPTVLHQVSVKKGDLLDWLVKHTKEVSGVRSWDFSTNVLADFAVLLGCGLSLPTFNYYWGNASHFFDVANAIVDGGSYDLELSCYLAPSYSDGHVELFNYRYQYMGFIEGKFMAHSQSWNVNWPHVTLDTELHFTPQYGISCDEVFTATDVLNRHMIHVGGCSDIDIANLLMAYTSSYRTTPFRVDIDIPMYSNFRALWLSRPESPRFPRNGSLETYMAKHTLQSVSIASTLLKLVKVNRWHEHLVTAFRLISPYIAQPDPDTLEAHTWLQHSLALSLPRFGAIRGLHAVFVSGEPLVLEHHPSLVVNRFYPSLAAYITYAPLIVAQLWWAEFMKTFSGHGTLEQMTAALNEETPWTTLPQYFLASCLSGITGLKETSFPWPGVGHTVNANAPDLLKTPRPLLVDKLSPSLKSELHLARVITLDVGPVEAIQYTVPTPPPGVLAVIGAAGVLLRQTPLMPSWRITPPTLKRLGRQFVYQLDWAELWAWLVSHRWYGYDVMYYPPTNVATPTHLTGWAANSTMVANPPPLVQVNTDAERYAVKQTPIIRTIHYSEPTEDLRSGESRTFSWVLEGVRACETLTYRSPESDLVIGGAVTTLDFSTQYAELYQGRALVSLAERDEALGYFPLELTEVRPQGVGTLPSKTPAPTVIEPQALYVDEPPPDIGG